MEHEIKFDEQLLKKALHAYVASLFKEGLTVEIKKFTFSRSNLKSVSVTVDEAQ